MSNFVRIRSEVERLEELIHEYNVNPTLNYAEMNDIGSGIEMIISGLGARLNSVWRRLPVFTEDQVPKGPFTFYRGTILERALPAPEFITSATLQTGLVELIYLGGGLPTEDFDFDFYSRIEYTNEVDRVVDLSRGFPGDSTDRSRTVVIASTFEAGEFEQAQDRHQVVMHDGHYKVVFEKHLLLKPRKAQLYKVDF